MLYRLVVQNFKSFKNRAAFSMIPDEQSKYVGFRETDISVLKDAVIYGPNASGKSNLIKALNFLRSLVVKDNFLAGERNQAFRLDEVSVNAPTLLSVEIRLPRGLFQYSIGFSFRESVILKESLRKFEELTQTWLPLFVRPSSIIGKAVDLNFSPDSPLANKYAIYVEDIASEPIRPFLSFMASKKLAGDQLIDDINAVYQWFEKLVVIFPETEYNLVGALNANEEGVNRTFKKYFDLFKIDIDSIKLTDVPANSFQLSENSMLSLKRDLIRSSQGASAILHARGQNYLVSLDRESNLSFKAVSFVHKAGTYSAEFAMSDESDGTKRLFDMIPLIGRLIEENHVVVIDEIDRSLHCLLTRQIMKTILEKGVSTNSQIIVSTHDVLLMDQHLLGRKEVWFVRRDKMESSLFPLDQFKFESEKVDFVRNYLIGRFNAIPEF